PASAASRHAARPVREPSSGAVEPSPAPSRSGPRSEGLPEGQVDQAALFVAEADVEPDQDRLGEREAQAAAVGDADVVRRLQAPGIAALPREVLLREEDPSDVGEGGGIDDDVPPVEHVELVDSPARLEVRPDASRAEKA